MADRYGSAIGTVPVLPLRCFEWFLEHRPQLAQLVSRWQEPGAGERRLVALPRLERRLVCRA